MYASLTTPIGKIFQPLLDAVGSVLAFFYSVIPNYPIDVALLTIVIMALLTPLTVKSTKNMAAMQALGPEMKKLQQKYKGADNRAQMNEEMMKLYKEHNVNPASGCLPMLLQMPAFFILYSVIRGLTNTVTTTVKVPGFPTHTVVTAEPRYIPHDSAMYHNIIAAHGQLISFGMDFSDKLLSHHSSIWAAIPYLILVIASVGLQYLQMSRLNARNPQAAQANPQAAMMQKYMPLIFGFIYLNVAALLNIYFIFSSAIRIGTQEVLFRKGMVGAPPAAGAAASKGPVVDRTERALPKPKAIDATATTKPKAQASSKSQSNNKAQPNGKNGKGRVASTPTDAAAGPKSPTRAVGAKKTPATSSNGSNGKASPATRGTAGSTKSVAKVSSNGSNGSAAAGTVDSEQSVSKDHPRSKAKRERKAR
jgi:YidC/Oxa1 family membrane protein insertase